jgi:hypothetical protein
LELQKELENWLADVKTRTKGGNEMARLVNIGGKTIRGSGFHVVGAWTGECGLTLCVKCRMMHAALDSDFLYGALFSE